MMLFEIVTVLLLSCGVGAIAGIVTTHVYLRGVLPQVTDIQLSIVLPFIGNLLHAAEKEIDLPEPTADKRIRPARRGSPGSGTSGPQPVSDLHRTPHVPGES